MKTRLDPCCCGLWHEEKGGKKLPEHHKASVPFGSGFCEYCRCERCEKVRRSGFTHSKIPEWRGT